MLHPQATTRSPPDEQLQEGYPLSCHHLQMQQPLLLQLPAVTINDHLLVVTTTIQCSQQTCFQHLIPQALPSTLPSFLSFTVATQPTTSITPPTPSFPQLVCSPRSVLPRWLSILQSNCSAFVDKKTIDGLPALSLAPMAATTAVGTSGLHNQWTIIQPLHSRDGELKRTNLIPKILVHLFAYSMLKGCKHCHVQGTSKTSQEKITSFTKRHTTSQRRFSYYIVYMSGIYPVHIDHQLESLKLKFHHSSFQPHSLLIYVKSTSHVIIKENAYSQSMLKEQLWQRHIELKNIISLSLYYTN